MKTAAPLALAALCSLLWPCTTRADELSDKVDKLFERYDRPDSPGCSIAVIHHGKVVYQRGYGLADVEKKVPNAPRTVFELASMSKQFTAMSIALLAEEGKLSFDDPIRKYLPELRECAQPIRVSHLLHHTGGLPDYMDLMGNDEWTMPNALKALSKARRLEFAPGDKYDYSNSGYVLLAWIVQRASGRPLSEFAEERIFRPLGMTHTVIRDSKDVKIAHRAKGYSRKRKGGIEEDTGLWNTIVGDGSVLTSVEDLYLWDQNFYHNKLGKGTPQLIETVETPGRLNNGKAIDYACGIEVGRYRGVRTVRHAGLWVGFGTDMVRCPDQEFTSICLANCSEVPSDDLNNRIMDICLADDFKSRRGSK